MLCANTSPFDSADATLRVSGEGNARKNAVRPERSRAAAKSKDKIPTHSFDADELLLLAEFDEIK